MPVHYGNRQGYRVSMIISCPQSLYAGRIMYGSSRKRHTPPTKSKKLILSRQTEIYFSINTAQPRINNIFGFGTTNSAILKRLAVSNACSNIVFDHHYTKQQDSFKLSRHSTNYLLRVLYHRMPGALGYSYIFLCTLREQQFKMRTSTKIWNFRIYISRLPHHNRVDKLSNTIFICISRLQHHIRVDKLSNTILICISRLQHHIRVDKLNDTCFCCASI